MVHLHWSIYNGPYSIYTGLSTMVYLHWFIYNGPSTLVYLQWSIYTMVYLQWFIYTGLSLLVRLAQLQIKMHQMKLYILSLVLLTETREI